MPGCWLRRWPSPAPTSIWSTPAGAAALNGEQEKAEFVTDPYFGVQVPTSCPGVPDEQMIPAKQWGDDTAGYEAKAKELAKSFVENFKKYTHMPADVVAAGPKAE